MQKTKASDVANQAQLHHLEEGKVTVFPRFLKGGTTYYARFRISNPKSAPFKRYLTETLKTSDLSKAIETATRRYWKIQNDESEGRPIRSRTVREEINAFLTQYQTRLEAGEDGYSVHMLRGFHKTIGRYFIEYLGDKRLQEVTLNDLEGYETWRQGYWARQKAAGAQVHPSSRKKVSRRTLQWEINAFKQFLRFARRHHKYSGNADQFAFKRGKVNRRAGFLPTHWNKLLHHMSRPEWTRVGKHQNDPLIARHRRMLRAYVLFMADTGLRPGEARHLKWSDITFESAKARPYLLVKVASDASKVRKARRVVSGVLAYNALRDLKHEREQAKDHWKDSDYIWCDSEGNVIEHFREGFNNLIKDASVPMNFDKKKYTIYSLRHTYMTNRLKENTPVHALAKNCGTSVGMIETWYSDAISEDFINQLVR